MSRRRRRRTNSNNQGNQRINNGLADVSAGLGALNSMTGGSFLSSYNTQAFSNNYSLLTLNRIILTYMYTGNGIFQTAVQLPIQDAIGKGIEIESGELDNDDINKVMEYWEEKGIWTTILDYMTWVRLFGGGALLVNTNQDPEKPLSIKNLSKTELEFYDLDRWQLDTNITNFDDWESYVNSGDQNEHILLYGQPIHESRFLRGKGKKAPHYVRRQLRGWGMSEGERMIRDLNLYLKTQDATFELIDEAKIDVYKIDGLAQKMMQKGGTAAITSRIQTANEIKNYVNAIVLDAKEDYQQKQMTFAGLSEIMNQNRMGVAAALRMPMTKLFGLSASGLNTGTADLENYNAMVESEIRAPLRPVIRQLLKITMSHLFGYVPEFSFKYPSLREMTPDVEQTVKNGEYNRFTGMYDRGLITSEEYMEMCRKAGIVQIETATEKGLNPKPEPPEPSAQEQSFYNSAFEEEKHPRDESGKFGKGGGSSKSKSKAMKKMEKDFEKLGMSLDDFSKEDLDSMIKAYEAKETKKEAPKKDDSKKSVDSLKDKYKGKADIGISQKGDIITIDKIISKGKGQGTAFMKDIADLADSSGKTITLTPSKDFGGDKKRLVEFYKRFGFKENKGKNRNYEISETMYREPKIKNSFIKIFRKK